VLTVVMFWLALFVRKINSSIPVYKKGARFMARRQGDSNGPVFVKTYKRDVIKPTYEIRKTNGSSAYIMHGHSRTPLNNESIGSIRMESMKQNQTIAIDTNGLSRAQISRIATDLQEDNPAIVFVKELMEKHGNEPISRIKNYQIVIKQGDDYVK